MAEGRIKWYSHQLGHGRAYEQPRREAPSLAYRIVTSTVHDTARPGWCWVGIRGERSKEFPRQQLRGDREKEAKGVGSRSW
jgi:hypothetical protein